VALGAVALDGTPQAVAVFGLAGCERLASPREPESA
jgi:hypothetical protein